MKYKVKLNALKTAVCTLLWGLGWIACALAEPTGRNGIWIDPPGYITQCFVCPDTETSDCMDAEPIYIERDRQGGSFHVTQLYPIAWSEQYPGMQYRGTLSLTVQQNKPDEATVALTCHWLREDGFGVRIARRIRLRYTVVDGWSQIEVLRESVTCQ